MFTITRMLALWMGFLGCMTFGMEETPSGLTPPSLGLGKYEPEERIPRFITEPDTALLFHLWCVQRDEMVIDVDFTEWLIKNGYIDPVTRLGPLGQTPAHYALILAQDSFQVLSQLRDRGESLQTPDRLGRLPIHYAAFYNLRMVMGILVPEGSDNATVSGVINAVDKEGRTPLFYAAQGGATSVILYLTFNHSRNLLLNLRDPQGASVMHYGMLSRNVETVLYLSKLFSEMPKEDAQGRTPVHYAAFVGFTDLFESLADVEEERSGFPGVDPCDRDKKGNTIFHYAALKSEGHLIVRESPIGNNNNDLFVPNNDGEIPAFVALENGWADLADALFREQLSAGSLGNVEKLLAYGMDISELQDVKEGNKSTSLVDLYLRPDANINYVREFFSWGINWRHRKELDRELLRAFSDLELEYTQLNNEELPFWQLPLWCLPCFYEQRERAIEAQIRHTRDYVNSPNAEIRQYVSRLISETLLIAMAYGHESLVEQILALVSDRDDKGNVRYYVDRGVLSNLFLRSVLASPEALSAMYNRIATLLNEEELKNLVDRAFFIAFGQRRFNSLVFAIEHGAHIPDRIRLHNRLLIVRPTDNAQEELQSTPDDYDRMLVFLRNLGTNYRTMLLVNQRLASVNNAQPLPTELILFIMGLYMYGFFNNHSL